MDFAKFNEDVCFRRANGKILWQPRIGCWFTDKMFEDGDLPGRYKGMTPAEVYRDLGVSARVYDYNDCFYPIYSGGVKVTFREEGNLSITTTDTPVGSVNFIAQSSPNSWAKLTKKYWVCNEDDLKVFTYIEKHTDWGFSQEKFDQIQKEWGDLGAPSIFMPRVNVQRLYIDLMGVEEAVYALMDYPELVEEYFDALHESQMKMIDVINASPIKIVNFGDNIHSGTLSPSLFEKYVLPEYNARCAKLHSAGKFVYSHYDGDNKGLMKYYQQTGLDGIEAITPVPQGDVTLEEVRENLGDNMFLLDGIPAVFFDEIYPVETLAECVHKILDLFAPNVILGISDEISSTGDIERVRLVSKIVDEYNAKIDARLQEEAR